MLIRERSDPTRFGGFHRLDDSRGCEPSRYCYVRNVTRSWRKVAGAEAGRVPLSEPRLPARRALPEEPRARVNAAAP